jgi:hypothetical protein
MYASTGISKDTSHGPSSMHILPDHPGIHIGTSYHPSEILPQVKEATGRVPLPSGSALVLILFRSEMCGV